MSKIYSIDANNLSSFGEASTRSLDIFGNASNELLNVFGYATTTELNPYFISLNPDFITNISDFATSHLNKGVGDFVTQTDSLFVRITFDRLFEDVPNAIDQIQSFSFNKELSDLIVQIDTISVSFARPLLDDVNNALDLNYLNFNKSINDRIDETFDTIRSFTTNKGLFDTPLLIDQLQSFSVTKLLQDFANPVDYVGIPDGSIFQLNKTIRNTALVEDETRFVNVKSLSEFTLQIDKTLLHTYKVLYTSYTELSDYRKSIFEKLLYDDQYINDYVTRSFTKSIIDFNELLDFTSLQFVKSVYDYYDTYDSIAISFDKNIDVTQYVDDERAFTFSKLLQDFANPVDYVGIPDGSTFQLNKTIRNTALVEDEARFRWIYNRSLSDSFNTTELQYLLFNKHIKDTTSIVDNINRINVGKQLEVFSTAIDSNIIFNIDTVLKSLVYLTDSVTLSQGYNRSLFDTAYADTITALNFVKQQNDSSLIIDELQSFDINKVLSDFANPVDYVGIPDGSTFQLNKTIRNTALVEDEARFDNVKTLDADKFLADDFAIISSFNKRLTDSILSLDNILTFTAIKSSFDFVYVNQQRSILLHKSINDGYNSFDIASLDLDKPLFDIYNSFDVLTSLNFVKQQNDSSLLIDELQSFTFSKLLQDFANPVDYVGIPDGSTFQLNKTIRNTALVEDQRSNAVHKLIVDSTLEVSPFSILTTYVDLENQFNNNYALDFTVLDNGFIDFHTSQYSLPISSLGILDEISKFDVNKAINDTLDELDNTYFILLKTINDFAYVSDIFSKTGVETDSDLSDITSISEKISLNYFKNVFSFQSVYDENSIHFNAFKYETVSSNDVIRIANLKQLTNLVTSIEVKSIYFNKPIVDSVNYIDSNFISVSKSIIDQDNVSLISNNVFSILKTLQDFANPVDYVGIPDGSTFQLNKTIRNTALVEDEARFVNAKLFNSNYLINDSKFINARKDIFDQDNVSLISDNVFSILKTLQDFANPVDNISVAGESISTIRNTALIGDQTKFINVHKDIFDQDLIGLIDSKFINARKDIFDLVGLIDADSKNITKIFTDFANPIDYVGIPDGSTFQLNKTIRNTALVEDERSNDVHKDIFDLVGLIDADSKNITKIFTDFVIVNDNLTINDSGNVYSSNADDTNIIEDTGILYMTDYVDISYFAQDYVGESRSFS
jgi:hypothetical protein